MSARTMPASERYPTFVATAGEPGDVIAHARRGAGPGAEPVVWVHESVHEQWRLPATASADHLRLFPGARADRRAVEVAERSGWVTCDGPVPVHVAFPRYCGDFAGCESPAALHDAVESWRRALGLAYVYSGASTLHALIRSTTRLSPAGPEPAGVEFTSSAWSVPANSWGPAVDSFALVARARGFVRCFDRSGSYLAAWSGLRLGTDERWVHMRGGSMPVMPESARPAGYVLVDRDELPAPDGRFDPFRRHGDPAGPVWLTMPLAHLAVELHGRPMPIREAWVQRDALRPLDRAAERVRDAREQLAGPALEALKVGYAAATAWFEFGPRTGPLARPHWRRSIIDRAVANTYRGLSKCTPAPLALADIDTAVFAVAEPDAVPDGLRLGTGLGAWKPKGAVLEAGDAIDAYTGGGARAVVRLAEGRQ